MQIIYDSETGNCKWIAEELSKQTGLTAIAIQDVENNGVPPFFLVTHTTNRGKVTRLTRDFLELHAEQTNGVCVSGDIRWGSLFGLAGDLIELEYEIPLVHKFDVRGYEQDMEIVVKWINEHKTNEK